MTQLKFLEQTGHFDGQCVRFEARCGDKPVACGVTVYALKHRCSHLPTEGLLPAEEFLDAFAGHTQEIREIARAKFARDQFELSGAVDIMVHDRDFHDWEET